MEYRTLPHGGEKISVIGLGSAGLHNASDAEVERTIDEAVDAGVNRFDFIPSESRPLAAMGRALHRHRADVHVQVHIGALYGSGAYGWTTDAKPASRSSSSAWQLLAPTTPTLASSTASTRTPTSTA